MKNIGLKEICFLFILIFMFQNHVFSGAGGSSGPAPLCEEAEPFCSDENAPPFPNQTNTGIPDGPNYGCLGNDPNLNGMQNPQWFYFQVSEDGDLELKVSQQNNNGQGIDLDFVMWGPFPDLPTGCDQVMAGASPIQCSTDPDANETIGLGVQGGGDYWSTQYGNSIDGTSTPPPGQVGEVYIVLLTNADGQSGTISLEQSGGDGATDCNIVIPCEISSITATPGTCDAATNTFSITGQLEFSDAPTTGELIIEDCNGNSVSYDVSTISSPWDYEITGIPSDGSTCTVNAYFSDETFCSKTSEEYQNPAACNCEQPNISVYTLSICTGNDIDLNAAIDPSSDPATITFYSTSADANNAENPIGNTVSVEGTYWVRAEDPSDPGCFTVISVLVEPTILSYTSSITNPSCGGVCDGAIQVTVTGGTAPYTYEWTEENDGAVGTNSADITDLCVGTYTVKVTDDLGCTLTSDEMSLAESAEILPSFSGDELKGCQPHTVNFTNTTTNISSGSSCVWDFGDNVTVDDCNTTVSHTYNLPGTYTVSLSVTDSVGCVGTYSEPHYVEIVSSPIADFTADPMITGTADPTVNFTNESMYATDYTWTFGDGSGEVHDFNTSHTYPDDNGEEYIATLIASNEDGDCPADTMELVINVKDELLFYIPNSFTPDGDGFNPTFQPIFTSGFDPHDYSLLVFNRWGELLFESHDTDIGWDGTYGSKLVKDGSYIWKINFKESESDKRHTYNGSITLIR